MSNKPQILTLTNGSLAENCYFFHLPGNGEGVLVDPGAEFDKLDSAVSQSGAKPVLALATHGHFDHVGQVAAFQKKYGTSLAMHPADKEQLDGLVDTYMFYGLGNTSVPSLEQELADGQELEVAGMKLEILHTPGHSPGGVCAYHRESGTLFSGDTLFKSSIGRSDLPGGSADKLEASIREKLYVLPDDTRVLPGHGPETTIGFEKANNPFVRA
jgi:hydroxyacylglutathione hydrolase